MKVKDLREYIKDKDDDDVVYIRDWFKEEWEEAKLNTNIKIR